MMARHGAQRGLSLPELMVALAIGLLLILAAGALLLATRSSYLLHDDRVRLDETGRFAIEMVSRAVRQAGYRDWRVAGIVPGTTVDGMPPVQGLDALDLRASGEGIAGPYRRAVNGSDVLALRFEGSGPDDGKVAGDGGILNCAGAAVPAASERGWSIFHVSADSTGEPELRCRYRGPNGWKSDAIARGIESFQVLYGVDSEGDGLPHRYLNASAIDDQSSPGASLWPSVVAVRIALLVRGTHPGQPSLRRYELFGPEYARSQGDADPGAVIDEGQLPAAARGLARRIYSATILLRNRVAPAA
jgi:type IV pilus assembly protein PilW